MYKFKVKHANLFDDIMPSTVRHVFEQELVRLLPKRDQNGVRILLIECGSNYPILIGIKKILNPFKHNKIKLFNF